MSDFVEVTEIAGDEVAPEQVERMCNRYYWAAEYCRGKDVLEVACGTGQGLGYLAGVARSVSGGDYSDAILSRARAHYGDRFRLEPFDAQDMPFGDDSFDVVILFEAIYYIPSVDRFISECRRVLRPNGVLLIATANKDLYDFNPSPHSHRYYGAAELGGLLRSAGFSVELFGSTRIDKMSLRQRILRPVKKIVVSMGLMPKTMAGKKLLKRFVFGNLVPLPSEISDGMARRERPEPIPGNTPDSVHKVIYCAASLV